jgi:hypothetical protein
MKRRDLIKSAVIGSGLLNTGMLASVSDTLAASSAERDLLRAEMFIEQILEAIADRSSKQA